MHNLTITNPPPLAHSKSQQINNVEKQRRSKKRFQNKKKNQNKSEFKINGNLDYKRT